VAFNIELGQLLSPGVEMTFLGRLLPALLLDFSVFSFLLIGENIDVALL
jgi:hypothetical protein